MNKVAPVCTFLFIYYNFFLSGASDDIVNCAIMLEVLISLSQHDEPLQNEVIFLFNGAEENILQVCFIINIIYSITNGRFQNKL